MQRTPTYVDTCRLEKACLQIFLVYEGKIHLFLPQDQLSAPLSLQRLDISEICVLPLECQTSVRITLQLKCCVADVSGRSFVSDSEIQFRIPSSYAQTKDNLFDAAIHLIHSCREAPDAFHICAQICLTHISVSSYAAHCRTLNRLYDLPLYPHIGMFTRQNHPKSTI